MPITPARVAEIVALDAAPILRNLWITDAYHQLALQLRTLFGDDLAWPVFATWASKQAGSFIRAETLPPELLELLEDRREGSLLDTAHDIVAAVARFIMAGNLTVFSELGLLFADFHATFAAPERRREDELAQLLARLREGPSEPDQVDVAADGTLTHAARGGQTLLREAMTHYFAALHEPDADRRAELILLGNALCGLHEQIRLQPYIAGALDSPTAQLIAMVGVEPSPLHEPLAVAARRAATRMMMTLELPDETLYLARDLPAPPGAPMWPRELASLRHPRLLDLAAQLHVAAVRERELGLPDRVEGWLLGTLARASLARVEAQGSAARDWTALGERMRFIFEYFRSRQRDLGSLRSPFSDAQRAELAAGRVPAGPL
jgi:hypothetical protein